MKLFLTRSCAHLHEQLAIQPSKYELTTFSDGELFLEINESVQEKIVWVVASTPAPAENIIELCLLLDALQRAGARIQLFMTYFGYARQDRALPGQPVSAQVLFHFFDQFRIEQFTILHIHSAATRTMHRFTPLVWYDFFAVLAHKYDILVAPDEGAAQLVQELARRTGKQALIMHKVRPRHEQVELQLNGDVAGKRVLIIDDMITTGHTIIKATELLKKAGAHTVSGAATHGVFSDNAVQLIEESALSVVYVTNSLQHKKLSSKIHVVSLVPLINELLLP
ncbi:MAG: Ribose-phosphate pyrophosphokinase [Candidatus Dependentiae bacterium ADurb.Bin331]|nr:MAG: Ribose-phosphate pyrophosphokinase [Candidatus Dependentiae bacterium ADurb.Bin331]